MKKISYFTIGLVLFIFIGTMNNSYSQSTDWLQWRGQNADGYSSEKDWNPEAALKSEAILWEINVGMGFSAPVIQGDRLFIMGNFEKTDSTFFLQKEKAFNFKQLCSKEISLALEIK